MWRGHSIIVTAGLGPATHDLPSTHKDSGSLAGHKPGKQAGDTSRCCENQTIAPDNRAASKSWVAGPSPAMKVGWMHDDRGMHDGGG
jgi:hypothetical protein